MQALVDLRRDLQGTEWGAGTGHQVEPGTPRIKSRLAGRRCPEVFPCQEGMSRGLRLPLTTVVCRPMQPPCTRPGTQPCSPPNYGASDDPVSWRGDCPLLRMRPRAGPWVRPRCKELLGAIHLTPASPQPGTGGPAETWPSVLSPMADKDRKAGRGWDLKSGALICSLEHPLLLSVPSGEPLLPFILSLTTGLARHPALLFEHHGSGDTGGKYANQQMDSHRP